ncbi:hypothetical protein [Streptomyces sp. NPDC056983]|uniref:hypothetical protein n=1 Tax=Streptomyces sp. NPDC056983 TaxID=3345987 RepID=UPI00363F8BB2
MQAIASRLKAYVSADGSGWWSTAAGGSGRRARSPPCSARAGSRQLPGLVIRFHIKGAGETCEAKVKGVTEYPDFVALLDGEGPANINPTATRDQQLTNIRHIYGPEKEALGAVAIEIELTNS